MNLYELQKIKNPIELEERIIKLDYQDLIDLYCDCIEHKKEFVYLYEALGKEIEKRENLK